MTEKFIVLGGSGYVGQAFCSALESSGIAYRNLSREDVDYTNFGELLSLLRSEHPTFLINCAGFTGKPNVDACEQRKSETIRGNIVLTETVANACEAAGVPLGQVSSGCIYAGAKIQVPGQLVTVERDLMKPEVKRLWQADRSVIKGFSEDDEPNFSFSHPPCSFYSGTKAIGEEVLTGREHVYVWRLRIPFDEFDGPRNYLSKILNYAKVYDNVNSLSHRGDFAKACLDLWMTRAPFGIYNVTNPGWVTTRQVAELLQKRLKLDRVFDYFENDTDFYQAALAPRSNTVLDTSKIQATDVQLRSVEDALEDAIAKWSPKAKLISA